TDDRNAHEHPPRIMCCSTIAERNCRSKRLAVVLDGGEGFVEMVEQFAPLLVLRRLAKADRVRLYRAPPDKQQVAVLGFDARPHLHALKAWRGLDQRTRLGHRDFEFLRLAAFDVEDGVFEDHASAARMRAATGSSRSGFTTVRP